jgi:hypothetical protein
MDRRSLRTATMAAAIAVASLPSPLFAAELVDKASMALQTSYVLKATLNYGYGTISASEKITIKNLSGGAISKINLSVMPKAFGELASIGGFTVDDRPVTAAWTNNSNLALQLGRNVADGETVVVRLTFKVTASGTIGTSLEGRLSKANGIMQVSHWFPIVSSGHATRYPGDSQVTRAATKIRLELTTNASSVRIAAPGTALVSSGRTHVYELTNARDFAFGASPYYNTLVDYAAGAKIVIYSTTAAAYTTMSYAKAALAKYEANFGAYGWSRFVIAQTGRKGSGNEYPGIVFLGQSVFTNREVVAHEIAHQWWYAMVGNDQIAEPWLDEGIAEWAAAYWYGDFESYVSSLPVNTPATSFPNIPGPVTSDDPNSYDQTIYFKSARFLDGLRTRMGTSAFMSGLRALVKANRNGMLTTREFYDTMLGYGAPAPYMDSFIKL